MRLLPALLAKIWPPAPLPAPEGEPMEATTHEPVDPIARDIEAAVAEHERAGGGAQDDYSQRLRSTIDELLERIGNH